MKSQKQRGIPAEKIFQFTRQVYAFYQDNKRPMPFRDIENPYLVYVSEVMLQQTQVDRVIPKYEQFTRQFPDFSALAGASLADVVTAWQGLGYNRRAKHLFEAAQIVVAEYGGVLPDEPEQLQKLPGIGAATAASITAFAFNKPVVFIETNIRRVFIHHFFADAENIPDSDLLPLVEAALDRDNPRQWYYALMDYGTWLKTQVANPNRKSKHYTKQSTFAGSTRQARGQILKHLTAHGETTLAELETITGRTAETLAGIVSALEKEGFIKQLEDKITLI